MPIYYQPGGDQSNQPPPGFKTGDESWFGPQNGPVGGDATTGMGIDGTTGQPNNSGTTPSWITQIFGDGKNGGLFGGGSGGGSNAITMAGLAAALQQWHNANQYQQVAQQAAGMANPFGDRSQYKDMLSQSYKDPTTILNDPAHQILLKRGLDDVASNNAAKGYLGSGNMAVDLSKYASDSNERIWTKNVRLLVIWLALSLILLKLVSYL